MTNGILLTRHNQEIAQWSPDPFHRERVGSGHETKAAIHVAAVTSCTLCYHDNRWWWTILIMNLQLLMCKWITCHVVFYMYAFEFVNS